MREFSWGLLADIAVVVVVSIVVGGVFGLLTDFANVPWVGIFIGACLGRAAGIIFNMVWRRNESRG